MVESWESEQSQMARKDERIGCILSAMATIVFVGTFIACMIHFGQVPDNTLAWIAAVLGSLLLALIMTVVAMLLAVGVEGGKRRKPLGQ